MSKQRIPLEARCAMGVVALFVTLSSLQSVAFAALTAPVLTPTITLTAQATAPSSGSHAMRVTAGMANSTGIDPNLNQLRLYPAPYTANVAVSGSSVIVSFSSFFRWNEKPDPAPNTFQTWMLITFNTASLGSVSSELILNYDLTKFTTGTWYSISGVTTLPATVVDGLTRTSVAVTSVDITYNRIVQLFNDGKIFGQCSFDMDGIDVHTDSNANVISNSSFETNASGWYFKSGYTTTSKGAGNISRYNFKDTFTLSSSGSPSCKIVFNDSTATDAEKTARDELKSYLNKITGATYTVITESSWNGTDKAIFLGNTTFATNRGVSATTLGAETSIIRLVDGHLIVSGGRPRGCLYAVYELLEQQFGTRWYTPWQEKVVTNSSLTLQDISRYIVPAFKIRSHYTQLSQSYQYANQEGWDLFNVRNRINNNSRTSPYPAKWGGQPISAGRGGVHTFVAYVPPSTYFSSHPEYFSMRDGVRVPCTSTNGEQLELTNSSVLNIIRDGVKSDIAAHGTAGDYDYYDISQNDGGCRTFSDSPESIIIETRDGSSGLLINSLNTISDGVMLTYPNAKIHTIAYNHTLQPPKTDSIRARDNIIVEICAPRSELCYEPSMGTSTVMPFLQNVVDWTSHANNIWVWDYSNGCYQHGHYFQPFTWMMASQIKQLRATGAVTGFFQENELMGMDQSSYNQFFEMNLWIYAKLLSNPNQDVEALIDDFVNGYYGVAASQIRSYITLVKQNLPNYPFRLASYSFINSAETYFDQAQTAAAGDSTALERVKDMRIHLDLLAMNFRHLGIRDYIASGGTQAHYPYKQLTLKTRILNQLAGTSNPIVKNMYYINDYISQLESVQSAIATTTNFAAGGTEYTPLPSQFSSLATDSVIDIPVTVMGPFKTSDFTSDPTAAYGYALKKDGANLLPFAFSAYQPDGTSTDGSIKLSDVTGSGYRWYKGPMFKFLGVGASGGTNYIFLNNDWTWQCSVWPRFANGTSWTAYASVKFTGSAYPYGSPSDPNAVWLDRIVLVRSQIPGDFDSSGIVDFKDLAIFGGQWLFGSDNLAADLAPAPGNDRIDLFDLAVFAQSWLTAN